MKGKSTRIIAAALAVIMLFALAACGDDKKEETPEPKYGFVSPVMGEGLDKDNEMQEEGRKLEKLVLGAGMTIEKIVYEKGDKDNDPRLSIYTNHIDGFYLRRMTNRNNNIQVGARSEMVQNNKTFVDIICKYLGADDAVSEKLARFTHRDSGYFKIGGVEYFGYCQFVQKKDVISHYDFSLNQ